MEQKEISDFYDDFVDEQKRSGVNDRLFSLYRRALKLGLQKNSTVLELGCGIGVMTYLLARTVRNGYIEAVDISPASIAFAKQQLKKKNISFHVADITEYNSSRSRFDLITLFDVIEHIPVENHEKLFNNISRLCHEKTLVLINIPSPGSVEYDRQYQPHLLQVIDQPIYLDVLYQNLAVNGLELIFYESYSVWNENDYHFFVARKSTAFTEISLAENRSFLQKALKKIERTWIRGLYTYPR